MAMAMQSFPFYQINSWIAPPPDLHLRRFLFFFISLQLSVLTPVTTSRVRTEVIVWRTATHSGVTVGPDTPGPTVASVRIALGLLPRFSVYFLMLFLRNKSIFLHDSVFYHQVNFKIRFFYTAYTETWMIHVLCNFFFIQWLLPLSPTSVAGERTCSPTPPTVSSTTIVAPPREISPPDPRTIIWTSAPTPSCSPPLQTGVSRSIKWSVVSARFCWTSVCMPRDPELLNDVSYKVWYARGRDKPLINKCQRSRS